jgi:hypothetical protein
VPEIRVSKSSGEPAVFAGSEITVAEIVRTNRGPVSSGGGAGHKSTEPICGGGDTDTSVGGGTEQPVKQRARLKLAQILYKEARRRRQKYVEELQNQHE